MVFCNTRLLYLKDGETLKSTAKLLAIIPEDLSAMKGALTSKEEQLLKGRFHFILDKTFFYPKGGGQP
jgi:Ser-tRNA(Ala) deacylase AlaX